MTKLISTTASFTTKATKVAHENIAFINETIRRLSVGKTLELPVTWVGVEYQPMTPTCQANLWYKLMGTETPAMIASWAIDTTGDVLEPNAPFHAKGLTKERFTVKGLVRDNYRILLSIHENDVPYNNVSDEYEVQVQYEGDETSINHALTNALSFISDNDEELISLIKEVEDRFYSSIKS